MTMREIKVWQAHCDACHFNGIPLFSMHRPDLPERWTYMTLSGCGLTGYTSSQTLCVACSEGETNAAA